VKKRSALSTKSKFQNNALLAEKYNLKSQ
jgi:hypothetical protein